MDYLIGKVIGNRYEIVEKVGTGGMATVYKAKCQVLDRFVAIKVLKDSLKHDTEVVKKFNTESRAAARLSHPNIVQVYDVSESGELDYIVMEHVDGITLKEYISEKGHLEPKEACEFAVQIGRALACAHAGGIIHRDIKPHNVLMASDGTLKVADFGIAQAATSETMVAGSGAMGSVHYISPEQARGGFINERSDIYSLGVVLYEMLTGEVPFDGANPVAVAIAKLEKDAVDIREKCNLDIPDEVCDIVMKAISKDQHSRYQSAQEMVADLEKVIGIAPSGRDAREGKFETKRLDSNKARDEYNMRKSKGKKRKQANNNVKIAIIAAASAVLLGILSYCSMSGGAQEYLVPDLTNLTIEEAEELLERENLRLNENIDYEESEEIEEGKIIKHNPGVNQPVKKNRKIKVTVSLGSDKEMVEVPNVVDLEQEEAEKRLRENGFKYVIEEEFSETIEIGYVIKQEPSANEKAEKGTEVTIYVSAEEEQAVVPKLTGIFQSEAEKLIVEAGLVVGDITMGESDEEYGKVIGQSPSAKTGVEKGTKVDLLISEGIPTETAQPLKKKTLTINIPSAGGETVHIKAVANGKEIYNKTHKRTEGTVDIPVQSSKDASVQVYMDGTLVADKVIYFD
ncbi:MAG: Stk1 family PASTA domain-containing Ser/Thr kinase [Clostridia bacterium]|nr:Stk1 family PASTA domain-containing Ser/Thr kinase [Clostridia bacterium]